MELLGIEVSCCEVWTNCRQKRCTSVIDVHLNTTMRLLTATLSPTPVPWLPVLANIEPPALRRKAAVHKLITKAVEHEECALHDDFVFPSQQKLMSRKPLWSNIQPLNTTARWRDDWKLAVVVNNFFVEDPAIRQPGFDLPRRQWCLLNRFLTAQGHCGAYHKRWGWRATTRVIVLKSRPCPISSIAVLSLNWTVVFFDCFLLTTALLIG